MNRKSALRVPKDRSKEVFADCQSNALAVESGRASGVDAHGQVCEGSEKKRVAHGWTFVFEREDTVIFPESIREIL